MRQVTIKSDQPAPWPPPRARAALPYRRPSAAAALAGMRAALLLLVALAGAAAALETTSLHTLDSIDKQRSVCHDLKHRKRTLKLIKVGEP